MVRHPTSPSRGLHIFYVGADMPWERLRQYGFRRRNTCLLKAFAEHPAVEQVAVVSWVLRKEFVTRLTRRRTPSPAEKVLDVFVCTLLPERPWFPVARWLNRWLYRAQILSQIGRRPHDTDIVWCYWPTGFCLANRLGLSGRLVFDADHNLIHDPNESAGPPAEVERCLRECALSAHLVVAASRTMLDWFRQNGSPRQLHLRNGVDSSRFSVIPRPRNSGTPRIGYIGALSRWIDFRLLEEIAALRPQWHFVVAGPSYRAELSNTLTSAANIEFVGELAHDEVPGFLSSLDVAIGLYRRDVQSDADSMKVFEYLAAGIPVVTTRFHDFLCADFDDLLEFGQNTAEFVKAMETVLNRDDACRIRWRARCRAFIDRNTWAVRVDEVVDAFPSAEPGL